MMHQEYTFNCVASHEHLRHFQLLGKCWAYYRLNRLNNSNVLRVERLQTKSINLKARVYAASLSLGKTHVHFAPNSRAL